jgi:hypothetical protein
MVMDRIIEMNKRDKEKPRTNWTEMKQDKRIDWLISPSDLQKWPVRFRIAIFRFAG